jgi:hypothetical protein
VTSNLSSFHPGLLYRMIALALIAIAVLSSEVHGETVAYFRRVGTSATNPVTGSTLDLATGPSSLTTTIDDIVPGETQTFPLTVTNSGSVTARYALSTTATNVDTKALATQLTLTIKRNVSSCSVAGFASTGTLVYGADSSLASLGSPLSIIGTYTAYPNGGPVLTEGSSDSLCLRIRLPAATGTSYQGSATAVTFTVSAHQA